MINNKLYKEIEKISWKIVILILIFIFVGCEKKPPTKEQCAGIWLLGFTYLYETNPIVYEKKMPTYLAGYLLCVQDSDEQK